MKVLIISTLFLTTILGKNSFAHDPYPTNGHFPMQISCPLASNVDLKVTDKLYSEENNTHICSIEIVGHIWYDLIAKRAYKSIEWVECNEDTNTISGVLSYKLETSCYGCAPGTKYNCVPTFE